MSPSSHASILIRPFTPLYVLRVLNIDRTTTPITLMDTAISQLGYHRLIVRGRVYNSSTLADLLTTSPENVVVSVSLRTIIPI